MNTRRAAASRRTTISQTQQLAKPKVSSRTYVAAAFSHRDIGHVWGSLRRIPGSFWACAARVVAEFKRAGSVRQPTRSRCEHLVWSCILRGAPFGLMLWLIWRCNWLGVAVGSLLRLAWRCGRLGAAAYQPIWHGNLPGVAIGRCRNWLGAAAGAAVGMAIGLSRSAFASRQAESWRRSSAHCHPA